VFIPDRDQEHEEQRKGEPQHHPGEEGQDGQRAGREAKDGESMASKTIRIRMRTFTSQVSQFRSSEMECMNSVVGRSLFVVDALVVVIRRFAADPGVGC